MYSDKLQSRSQICISKKNSGNSIPIGLIVKTSSNMPAFCRGNCKTDSKTNDYLTGIRVVGLDRDHYNSPKNQWSVELKMWMGITFLTFMFLIAKIYYTTSTSEQAV